MAFSKNENPLLIDLDRGIVGTLIGTDEKETNSELIHITFCPLNTNPLFPEKIQYRQTVKRDGIHRPTITSNEKGVEKNIVLIFEGLEGGLGKFLEKTHLDEIERLKRENRDLKIKMATYEQERKETYTGAAETIKNLRQTRKISGEGDEDEVKRSPFGRFDF